MTATKEILNLIACNRESVNTREYYRPFESIYIKDALAFSQALCELRKTQENHAEILIHIMRLSLYFDIDIKQNRDTAKHIIQQTRNLRAISDFQTLMMLMDFFISFSDSAKNKHPQLYYTQKTEENIFQNLLALSDINNIPTANVYLTLYQAKFVSSCPTYIKTALKVATICDTLCGDGGKTYFSNRKPSTIQKDMIALQTIGLSNLSELFKEYLDKYSQTTHYPEKFSKQVNIRLEDSHYQTVIETFLIQNG